MPFIIKGPKFSVVCSRLRRRISRKRLVLRRMGREAVKAFRGSIPYNTGIRKRKEPDGTPYKPLESSTLEVRRKRGITRKGAFILRETGTHIVDPMTILEIGDDHVTVGVRGSKNAMIASAQHSGFTTAPDSMIPNKKVPARKIFGISEMLATRLNQLIHEHITRGINRAGSQ